MKKDKYDALRERYPEFVSKDQVHVICKMSKRSVTYLLEHSIIPFTDNGKKTHRYQIALEDIIAYMKMRENIGSMIPRGAVNSREKRRRSSFSKSILPGQEEELKQYFQHIYTEFSDMLSSYDLVEMTGLSRKTILELLKRGAIKSLFINNKYFIPKNYMLDFVVSPQFTNIKSNSPGFIQILGGFEKWKAARS